MTNDENPECGSQTFLLDGHKRVVRIIEDKLIIESPLKHGSRISKRKQLEVPVRDIVSVRISCEHVQLEKDGMWNRMSTITSSLCCRTGSSGIQNVDESHESVFSSVSYLLSNERNLGNNESLLIIYKLSKFNKWSLQTLLLSQEKEIISSWAKMLRTLLDEMSLDRPKNLLVFINPYGGRGKALKIFSKTVEPILKLAEVQFQVVITKRPNHARDSLRINDLHGVDGVVCVGGDGMFSELFNGLLLKSLDVEKDINDQDSFRNLNPPTVRVGFIPGGSTNAVASSLHGTTDVVTATLHIILGDRRSIDVASVVDKEGKLYTFFMAMISYGYFGDLMAHSERLRWLGPKRYDISGALTFLNNKSYKGMISFVEETDQRLRTDPYDISKTCQALCQICNRAEQTLDREEGKTITKTVEGNFLVVTSAVMLCACKLTPHGLSPSAHLGDGQMDLILVRKTSRTNYFRYLYRTGYMNKNPFELPFVEIHRAKEFRYTSAVGDNDKKSVWNCDGEILENSEINVKVHCQILPVFARGIEK